MSAPVRPPECPDPRRSPVPDDPELQVIEDRLAAWVAERSSAEGFDDEETRVLVRALVTRLHALGCPPEMMLLHLKQVLTPLGERTPVPRRRGEVELLRDTLVRVAIEEYFGYRRPRQR
ncbi:MAG: hypothetical protein HOQ11_03400 [Gemmatimonadaceae bacterium]|nr:hypothetical protein [Gemmatimonadaceae bacterium]NUQ93344.1 hypothetical protein [Gemmatimonadaceae bacterium]NUR18798.1 hypothetical protein [Gemmatimonadaceae bacterium]NUS96436.1 hypothetical protein [Gemmatimonadaceae bacterium]